MGTFVYIWRQTAGIFGKLTCEILFYYRPITGKFTKYPSCLSPYVNKSVHMQCSAVMELVVDGNVTPESDVVVTRKRERSDDQSEDVKKLQKEAEVKEERRVKLRKLRGMDSSQEEGGLASSQVAAVSVAPVSASNHGAGGQVEVDGNVTLE